MRTLAVAGVIYLILLIGYSLYSVYALHHLNEFGYSGDTSAYMFRVYLGISLVIVVMTVIVALTGLVSQ